MRKQWMKEHSELQAPAGKLRSRFTLMLPRGTQVLGVHADMGPDTPGPWLVWTTLEPVEFDTQTRRRFAVAKPLEVLSLAENEWLIHIGRLSNESMYGRGHHVFEIVMAMFRADAASCVGIGALAVDETAGQNA